MACTPKRLRKARKAFRLGDDARALELAASMPHYLPALRLRTRIFEHRIIAQLREMSRVMSENAELIRDQVTPAFNGLVDAAGDSKVKWGNPTPPTLASRNEASRGLIQFIPSAYQAWRAEHPESKCKEIVDRWREEGKL